MARALINVPKTAKRGQIIEIKTLISHIMETGFRRNDVGQPIPRNIITNFVCTYNGEEIFRADLYPAIGSRARSFDGDFCGCRLVETVVAGPFERDRAALSRDR